MSSTPDDSESGKSCHRVRIPVKRGKGYEQAECEAIVRAMIQARYNPLRGSDQPFEKFQESFRENYNK